MTLPVLLSLSQPPGLQCIAYRIFASMTVNAPWPDRIPEPRRAVAGGPLVRYSAGRGLSMYRRLGRTRNTTMPLQVAAH